MKRWLLRYLNSGFATGLKAFCCDWLFQSESTIQEDVKVYDA